MTFIDKLLADPSKGFLKRHQKTVAQINALEAEYALLTDEAILQKTQEWKAKFQLAPESEANAEDPLAVLEAEQNQGVQDIHHKAKQKLRFNAQLDPILAQAFALVREASKRSVSQRHFDVQLLGGIALHYGNIAEMRTGEGKTLVATLPLYLNALLGKGSHLITVNDYLAKLAVENYGPVYSALGVSVGVIVHDSGLKYEDGVLKPCSQQEAYAQDITYGTNNEIGFDYLRDNMASETADLRQRDLFFAIVDEADSILIDEARTPLIISGAAEESGNEYAKFSQLVPKLKIEVDYTVDEKDRVVALTREGIAKMERLLGVENIYGEDVQLAYHLEEALKANILFKRDKDYVVQEGEVVIVDEFTGRLMPGRRYSEGLHQAIEAKEGVLVQRESVTYATISFQNLFRNYTKLSGMTGTAATESEEFHKIYGLEVLVIPTNQPMIRKDFSDKIFKTEEGKFMAVVRDIKELNQTGRPILVGTISVEKNEYMSALLKRHGVKHEILNAKNHEREGQIIAQAGSRGAVTLATNMAGRGTDIMLGGVKPTAADFTAPDGQLDQASLERSQAQWQKEHADIVSLGGLHVIGTERHESRRIDNQLRGRAGRQGDLGSSQFYVSTEDDLLRIFGGERLKGWLQMMGLPDDEPIEHKMISKSLETAQKRVEGHNFDIRKRLIQYDDVLNRQREVIYKRRRKVLLEPDDITELEQMLYHTSLDEARRISALHASGYHQEWDLERLTRDLAAALGLAESERLKLQDELAQFQSDAAVEQRVVEVFRLALEVKKDQIGKLWGILLRSVYLRTIDMLWVEHLNVMQELRTGVGLRGYAQMDPLVVYKQEGFKLFQGLLSGIDLQTMRTVLRVEQVEQVNKGE